MSNTLYSAATNGLNMSSNCSSMISKMSPVVCDDCYIATLRSNVQVSLMTNKKRSGITLEALVQNWGIGIDAVNRTVEATTTQRGIRTTANASLVSRGFKTKNHQLRYRRINTDDFTYKI